MMIEFIYENLFYTVTTFLGLVVIIGGYYKFLSSQKSYEIERKAQSYVAGLNEMLRGNISSAKAQFKEAVNYDSENLDAYLKLGSIYRMENEPKKALKIHTELTIRSGLSNTVMADIYKNIVEDYIELDKLDDALKYIDKIIEIEPKHPWMLENHHKIFAMKKDWKNAFTHLKAGAAESEKSTRLLSLYKIANAKQLMDIEQYHDARLLFKEAIKLDKVYPFPYIYIGESYYLENRIEDGIKFWRKFTDTVPEKAYLVFDLLSKAYFEMGNYAAMEVFYQKIAEKDPGNYKALNKLGEIYFKKGNRERAMEVTEQSLKINPYSAEGLKNLISYMNNSSDLPIIKEKALSLAQSITKKNAYQCKNCNEYFEDIQFRCPECQAWDCIDV